MHEETKGARILVETCGNVRSGENVLVVTDTDNIEIAEFICDMSISFGAETVMMTMTPRKNHGEDPPLTVSSALLEADVIFAVTTFSLFHSSARINACKNGARWVNMAGYTREMLKKGGLMVDFHERRVLAEKIAAVLTEGKDVRVITDKGTDISFSIEGRDAIPEGGVSDKPGMINSPPDIETCIAPVEGTAQGRIVIDGSIVQPGLGPIEKEVDLTVKDGLVSDISGSREAEIFSQMLEKAAERGVYNIGEFGIGLNPACRLCGSMLEDEGVYGTAHFGIGDNHTMGGTVEAPMHTDAIFWKPSIFVDGKKIMDKGDLLI